MLDDRLCLHSFRSMRRGAQFAPKNLIQRPSRLLHQETESTLWRLDVYAASKRARRIKSERLRRLDDLLGGRLSHGVLPAQSE